MRPAFWESHVILNGVARDYHVADFPGPLSVKSVIRGEATWSTDEGRFAIRPGACLVLNDKQPYSITVESREPVETFCVFFKAGFVEDVARALSTPDAALLDDPFTRAPIDFADRLPLDSSSLTRALNVIYRQSRPSSVLPLAEALVAQLTSVKNSAARIPAVRSSTRIELLQRVRRGRNLIEGTLAEALPLDDLSRRSALSPYHFHRTFRQVFGETPAEYRTRRRMELAATLLRKSNDSVTDVCLACGFTSPATFSTLFRRHFGLSPSGFRNAHI